MYICYNASMEFLRGRETAKNSVLHVDEREIFLPFRGIQELQPVDLDRADRRDEAALVLRQEIEFKGIMGTVSIYADLQPEEKDCLTPLGDVYLTTTYSDGHEHITEAPCFMGIEFKAKTREQFDILEEYQAKIFLNDEVYYLDCDGGMDPEFAFREFGKRKHVFIQDWNLKNKDKLEVNVLLPQNVRVLSTIRMQITDYDDDDNDNEESVVASSPTPEVITT